MSRGASWARRRSSSEASWGERAQRAPSQARSGRRVQLQGPGQWLSPIQAARCAHIAVTLRSLSH